MRAIEGDAETRQIVRAAEQGARLFCHRPHVDEAVHGLILTAWVKAAQYPPDARDSHNRAQRGITYFKSTKTNTDKESNE